MVKVDWPKPRDGGLRLDLEAVAFSEYIVGAQPGRPNGTGRGLPENAKGLGGQPVAMFACHTADDDSKDVQRAFYLEWLEQKTRIANPSDRSQWNVQQAWCVNLLRRPMQATRFRRSPLEQRQYRIRLCPETEAGVSLAESGRMEEFARRFMGAVEADCGEKLVWMGAAHFNTDQPHVHLGARGIGQSGGHIFFPQSYLRPTLLELKRNPAASSPIEWRARAVLAEMMVEMGGKRAAG